jgi:hypothetical protein
MLMDDYPVFARMDYQYTGRYQRSAGPGTTTYSPDSYMAEATSFASARVGISIESLDVALFVNNLFKSTDLLSVGTGRSGCSNAACTTYSSYSPIRAATTFRPREWGMSISHKF